MAGDVRLDYEVVPPAARRRDSRDRFAIARSFLAFVWSFTFLLFTSSNYIEVGGYFIVVLIWALVSAGSAGATISRSIRSVSVGDRHRRARTTELVACCLACGGWLLYVALTVAQMIAYDDPVPAIFPFYEWFGWVGPTRLSVLCIGTIMFLLTAERIYDIAHIILVEHEGKGHITL